MNDHIQRLTLCNRKLLEELEKAREKLAFHIEFLNRFLHPEDLGWAVTEEVRDQVRKTIKRIEYMDKNIQSTIE